MNDRKIRIIIAGCRSFNNYDLLCEKVNHVINPLLKEGVSKSNITLISGGALGADLNGERYGNEFGYNIKRFPAEWNIYGKPAGMIRNRQMAEYASEEGYDGILIAFWNGTSRGTKNMIDNAKKYKLKTIVVYI